MTPKTKSCLSLGRFFFQSMDHPWCLQRGNWKPYMSLRRGD
ncbi:hypothetical protein E1A91_D11G061600v1 [Gossypium mustelinum]|uniref:Uncharacterized protein n=1 Tax=Gossypium mustelinum TaxID=34275 RepID=A0A5D2SMW8_GOSMU|nr:hypothetical protein E1A91_D11G061600v1 [Gossypium mustelinum]